MSSKYVEFKISPREEAKNLPKIFDLAGKWILTPSLRDRFSKMSEKEILLEVKRLHKGNKKRFENIKAIYEEMWKEVGKEYIKNIEKTLDWKIKDEKICYIVPSLWGNIADVLGKKNVFIVAAEVQQNPLDFIMLHELTHLYYSDIINKLKLFEGGMSPLMEGVDHLILFKSPINKLFKGIKYEENDFVRKNRKFMKELEKAWEKRENFKTFLEKAIKIQAKFPNVVIC